MTAPSPAPIAAAMGRLETESAFTVLARAAALEAQGRSIINLGIGQPDFPTPEHIVEAGVKALRDGLHGYTPANGVAGLREAVAGDLHRRLGVEIDPGHVLVVPGGKVTIFFACLACGEPGGEILYPDPGFPIYRSAAAFSGARAVPYPIREANDFAFSAADVLARMTERTRLVILNSPANPTGGATPREEVERLVAGLARFPKARILSDEIYDQMVYRGGGHVSLLEFPHIRERLIYLNGWSKTYAMTGWRIGYGVWPADMIERATVLAINVHSCVNAPTQAAAEAALTGPQDAVAEMMTAFAERRVAVRDLAAALPGVTCAEPGGAFYAFPNISATGRDDRTLARELLEEAGVATIPGTSFGAEGAGYLRLSYANSLANIEAALARMARHLGG